MYYHVGIDINHGGTVCAPTDICGSRDVLVTCRCHHRAGSAVPREHHSS